MVDVRRESGERTAAPDRGLAARRAALVVLRGVREGRTFETALDDAVPGLQDADRRLAHEIAAGVLRARTELDQSLATRVTGGWRHVADDMKDILRIGAYQLKSLDKVPVHAAVAATVELAKREHGQRPAGFVNAVLRRLATEGDAGAAEAAGGTEAAGSAPTTQPPNRPTPQPTDDLGQLAKRHSHPRWLVARWVERFGRDNTERLLVHNNQRPPVQLQAARWSLDQLRDAVKERGLEPEESPERPGIGLRGVSVPELPGFAEGAFVVQDAAQALTLSFIAVPDGATVWDACAAPGGKSAVLARRCRVVASDVRAERLPRLAETVRRAGPGTLLLRADALAPPFGAGTFQAVVLDAPCSATGTLARHPDGRWRLNSRRLERLAALQQALLDGVAPQVAPGGLLAYMTCSLEREENENQVDAFLERHPEFRRDADDLFIFPPDRGTDGGYAARLVRTA
ncbi:MAG TPA: transcription antitermination factor NusB [Gemmatimonadales bacterium]|nr:transcription antitermination factor NusB [Gemmatimonadales bacterium]